MLRFLRINHGELRSNGESYGRKVFSKRKLEPPSLGMRVPIPSSRYDLAKPETELCSL
jgi:hypothetical protein